MLFDKHLSGLTKKLSRKNLYEFISEELSKIPTGAIILNIGSGGEIGHLLKQHSINQKFEVVSLDIDSHRQPDIIGDICISMFKDESFDFIIILEVLEHVHDPRLALENIRESLKNGGKLIMSTPFMLPMHDRPHDYFRYTRHGLELLLKKYHNVEIRERNTYLEAIDVIWVRLWQTNERSAKLLCYLIIPLIYFIKKPITDVLNLIIKTDAMTTGYITTAIK